MKTRDLIAHLKGEAETYREFIGVLQAETENLVSRNYRGLYETTSRKEALMARIEGSARVRSELMEGAAREFGVEADGKLSTLAGAAPAPFASELSSLRDTLSTLIESIREISRVNASVVSDSLENVNKALGFLSSFRPSTVYKPTGAFDTVELKGSQLSEGA